MNDLSYRLTPENRATYSRKAEKQKLGEIRSLISSLVKLAIFTVLFAGSTILSLNLPKDSYELPDNSLMKGTCEYLQLECAFLRRAPYSDLSGIHFEAVSLYALSKPNAWELKIVMTNAAARSQPMPGIRIRFLDPHDKVAGEFLLKPAQYAPNSLVFGKDQVQKMAVNIANIPNDSASYQLLLEKI